MLSQALNIQKMKELSNKQPCLLALAAQRGDINIFAYLIRELEIELKSSHIAIALKYRNKNLIDWLLTKMIQKTIFGMMGKF